MTQMVPVLIGDRWLVPDCERSTPVHRPATGEVIARTPHCGAADVDRAVQAAQAAFPAWSRTPAPDRARVLFRRADRRLWSALNGGDQPLPPDDFLAS